MTLSDHLKAARRSVVIAVMRKNGELSPGDKFPSIAEKETCNQYHARCKGLLCRLRNWLVKMASR